MVDYFLNGRLRGVAAVAAAVALGAFASGCSSSTPRSAAQPSPAVSAGRTEGQIWMDGALGDFTAMNGVLVSFVKTLGDWRAGKASNAAASSVIDHSLPQIIATGDALARRAPLAGAPKALDDYRLAVALYAEAARCAKAATTIPDGGVQSQLRLSYERIRALGDRVFDQAVVELAPYLPSPPPNGIVVIQKPAEVPDWAALGLAVGPPLATAAASTSPHSYEATRPEKSFALWADAVVRAQIPSGLDETAAINSGSRTDLGRLSERLTAAAASLTATFDPVGERAVSTRLRLGLLVQAEATRAAEAASLIPASNRQLLDQTARTLAVIGDRLWDARLGHRKSGFPDSLLSS